MGQWIVCRTQPHREKWAAENVERQGCGYYLPQYEVPLSGGRLKQMRSCVLFPSYLFVEIKEQWRFLLSTFGVSTVLMRGGLPAAMPVAEIDKLKGLQTTDGLIRLPDRFITGQAVRIKHGPLQGHEGLYQGQTSRDRQKVLLDLLGGRITALVANTDLEAV